MDWESLLKILLQGDDNTITELELPEGLTRLHAQAIAELKACEVMIFPSTLTYIGNWNFITCNRLATFIVRATTPPTCQGSNVLVSLPAATNIYVPDAAVNDYKAANVWSNRAAYIFPLSDLNT